MKSCKALLIALGLVSSTAMAQTTRPEPAPQPSRMPTPTMGSDTAVPAMPVKPAISAEPESGELSSGSAGSRETTTSGSGGQLITPEIVRSRPSSASSAAAIAPQTRNGVTYLCGGVGENESAYMKESAARGFDLMMTFAEKSGSYVADVAVVIKDARGKTVLETTCDGPILLVDLPAAGGYRIHAEAGGRAIDRTVLLKGDKGPLRQITFSWPNSSNASAGGGARDGSGRESAGGEVRGEPYPKK